MKDAPTIRIRKKKLAAEGHHVGSWKVAYADFVTALMAFFLVMWILSMDQSMREEIQSYFNDPFSTSSRQAGISESADGGKSPIAEHVAGAMKGSAWKEPARQEVSPVLHQVEAVIQREIAGRPDLARLGRHVAITVTDTGLAIDLIEAEDNLFFASGSAAIPPAARSLLALVGRELGRLGKPVVLEGHTDAAAYRGRTGYSNWELSIDRANAVRRALEASGLRPGQVAGVRGFADNKPREPGRSARPANRRVCISVNFAGEKGERQPPKAAGGGGGAPFSVDVRPAEPLQVDLLTP